MIQFPNGPIQPTDPIPQTPPKPKRQFRWGIVIFIAIIFAFLWFIKGIEPSFEFREFMRWIRIRQMDRYTKFVILGVASMVVVLIYKIVTTPKDK